MEILGEFDGESPLYVSFCRRISLEDFETQSVIYTQESLRDLFAEIDRDPGICEPIVRKKKQRQQEDAGLASYLKAKLSSFFRRGAPVRTEEVREEAKRLKREMRKARDYALAARRAPSSSRPLERTERPDRTPPRRPESPPGRARMTGVTGVTALTVPAMPKIFGPFPTQHR